MMSQEYETGVRALRAMESARHDAVAQAVRSDRAVRALREIEHLAREVRWESPASMREFCERVRRIVLVGPADAGPRGNVRRLDDRRLLRELGADHPDVRG